MSRSVTNFDIALKVVTNARDACLVKVKAGYRDQFSTQLAIESTKAGLLSPAIATFPSIPEV